jgi:hypothetical protein
VNANCEWPPEADAKPLDLSRAADRRHLNSDVEFGEDLAIRYMDAHPGASPQESDRIRNQCVGRLFTAVMAAHQVTPPQIMSFWGRRPVGFDAAVMLSFGLLYAWCAFAVAGRLRRSGKGIVLSVYVSLAVAAAGVIVGELWAGALETLRIGNGHLSYRVDRVPWGHYHIELFLAALALFSILAASQRRRPV